MNTMIRFFLVCSLLPGLAFARETFLDSVKRLKWDDLEVVWVQDEKFPKFTASLYIQDGSFTDPFPGLTQATFDLFTSGTRKESQRELAEFFDFYGATLKSTITHEYSVLTIQALTRDIAPVMGKVCEIFGDAQYPQSELTSYVSRSKSRLKNLVTSHGALADRVFRKVSLEGTPFASPSEGSLDGFDKLTPELLRTRLQELAATRKVLYLAGPPEVKALQKSLASCAWKNEKRISPVTLPKAPPQSALYLVPVPGANQAQIRIGRYLTTSEVQNQHEHFQFLAGFLGGSFTSKLVQELRTKRGLTYSAGAYVSMQRDYGRAGIMTFSKNESAAEAIAIIRDIFAEVGSGRVTEEEFKHAQGHQIGGYAFQFEEPSAFIAQLMLYDHQGKDLKRLAVLPQTLAALKVSDLARTSFVTFPWERQVVVVVGDPSLAKSLARIRPVKVLDHKEFL
jgi:zinc protease